MNVNPIAYSRALPGTVFYGDVARNVVLPLTIAEARWFMGQMVLANLDWYR